MSGLWKTLPRNRAEAASGLDALKTLEVSTRTGLRVGFFTNLLNPKVGVFYISLLPQFLPVGPSATTWGIALVAIHLAVTFLWYPALIMIAARARGVLLRGRVRAWMERVAAVVLIGVGVRLATESR